MYHSTVFYLQSFLLIIFVGNSYSVFYNGRDGTTCFSANDGTDSFYDVDLPHDNKISELSKFEGCETIIGNINLMGLKDPDGSKLAFFSSVKKITGYIAVINSEMPYLPFQNIQIISGQNLIKAKKLFKYALFIRGTNVTEYAGLNELMEISNGDVMVEENNDILTGFMNTIHWKDILMNNSSMPAIIPRGGSLMNIQSYRDQCHVDCPHPGRCWGPQYKSCHKMSMEVCQDKCEGGRCYFPEGATSPICCHRECAGGCHGMTNSDCFGCRNFNATGSCVPQCPPERIYDRANFKIIDNPDVLYGLGNECLNKCPTPFLVEEGNCVKRCSDKKMTAELTDRCIPCPPQGCPKRCDGFNNPQQLDLTRCSETAKRGKRCWKQFIQKYENCTIIDGNVDINSGFTDKFGENTARALEGLSSVQEITGYLSIYTNNKFDDLSFLRNLKKIRGMDLKSSVSYSCKNESRKELCPTTNLHSAITIQAVDMSLTHRTKTMTNDYRLNQLRLNSLQLIENGIVVIYADSSTLCYLPDKKEIADIMRKDNLSIQNDVLITYNETYCRVHEKLCHDTCIGGCWGPGPSNCVQCTTMSFEGMCVANCYVASKENGIALYDDVANKTCRRCHVQCDPSLDCTGPNADQCRKCKNYKDGPYCVAECPSIKYNNDAGVCMNCHDECDLSRGCSGPNSFIGAGGCDWCPVVVLMEETYANTSKRVWGQCEAACGDNQYPDNFRPYRELPTHGVDTPRDQRVKVCTPCHEWCSSCDAHGTSIHLCRCKYAEDEEKCVDQCPPGKWKSLVDKKCRPCDGECPNNCIGSDSIPLNSTQLQGLANCNLVEGSIIINYASWTGENSLNATSLEALNEIETITGRLVIRDSPDPTFTNLAMFRRLISVQGLSGSLRRRRRQAALVIEVENNTALETADLISLKNVGGPIRLTGDNLCYVDRVDWGEKLSTDVAMEIEAGADCSDKKCNSECAPSQGCLGPGNDMCSACRTREFDGVCTPTCQGPSYDDGTLQCKQCHENCITCSGAGNHLCDECRFVFDGSACVIGCTKEHTYVHNQVCHGCAPSCQNGCTGPGNYEGLAGCNECVLYDNTGNDTTGAQQCAYRCEEGSYERAVAQPGYDDRFVRVCEPCHEQCAVCTDQYALNCESCKNVRQGKACLAECDDGYYEGEEGVCRECHSDCATCSGGGNSSCTTCDKFELPTSDVRSMTCVEECPEEYGFQIRNTKGSKEYWVCAKSCKDPKTKVVRDSGYCQSIKGREAPVPRENTVAVAVAVGIAIVFVILVVGFLCWKRTKQSQKKRMNLLKHAQQMHDNINPIYEPVMQEDTVYPLNDGQLIIVTEDSLEIGDVLGSGAFGKVYEGRWHPQEQLTADDRGLRVAIKILKDSGDPESTREFFDEAVVMGKLDHKHLVRILCLCAGKTMLVTQLMPLGSLLDYVRKYKQSLTPHHLLTYGLQIAKGMAYLEENNVVHRDLAARNVLVQTPTFVKITDFGLAKCLSRGKQMFTSEGGKLPIKWLAIESLKYRQFTSRSDTWSFGVTIWEVLEFGQLPWRTKPPNELIRSLEMGERLPKPKTCTLEVYALMLRCWVLEPTARPNFEDLMGSMEEFLKEPNRFVHNPQNNRASTEGSFLSPHASVTSEYRDSGIVDVDRNYENDERAQAMQRALYDATSTLKYHDPRAPNYDPALTADQDQDDVFSESPTSTARNSVIDANRHSYVQDYLIPDQYSVDEGNGTDSSQDQGYVQMNGSDYADLEQHPEYSNAHPVLEEELTQSLLEGSKHPVKGPNKNKFLPNRSPSPRPIKHLSSPKPASRTNHSSSPRNSRIRDDGYSCLKEPLNDQSVSSDS